MAVDWELEKKIALLKDMKKKAENLFASFPPKGNTNYVITALEEAIMAATEHKAPEAEITELVDTAKSLASNAMQFHTTYAKIKKEGDQGAEATMDESGKTFGSS